MKSSTPVPNEKYDIDQFRRRKKMRKLFSRGLLIFLCLLLAVGVYFLADNLRQKAIVSQTAAVEAFPINLKGEDPMDVLPVDNNLVVLGENKTLFYTPSAAKQSDTVHGMGDPTQRQRDGRLLTYDQNGTAWRVDYKGKTVKEGKTDSGILFGRLGHTGMVALAVFEDRFNTSLTIFNREFDQIYKYNESQEYIVGFEFLTDQKGVLLLQHADGANINSKVVGLDFTVSEGTEFFTVDLADTIVYTMAVKGDNTVVLVTDKGIVTLDKEGKQTTPTTYIEKIRSVETDGKNIVVALQNLQDVNKTDLLVLNDDGTTQTRTTVEGIVRDLYCDKDRILMLNKQKLLVFDYTFQLIHSYDNAQNYSKVIRLNQDIYALSSEYLYVVK